MEALGGCHGLHTSDVAASTASSAASNRQRVEVRFARQSFMG